MNSIKRLNRNLYQLTSALHYFETSTVDIVNYCTPSTRNGKTLYTINFVSSLESITVDFNSLSNVSTFGMLGIDHHP